MDSVYVHIPFCKKICSYCDFCKVFYDSKLVDKYLDSLEKEINSRYNNEVVKTLYIGGGTPNSLNDNELERLLNILTTIRKEDYEYTIECNIELLTLSQIKLFKKYGINRVSIGVQTFNNKFLKFLNRNHTKEEVIEKINLLKENGINNINIDLIYAIPNETLEDLQNDLDIYKSLNIPHISTYSLIIEPHTVLYNNKTKNIDEDLDYEMYQLIIKNLSNYNHYETSNFSKPGFESKHNLTYWNNNHYYGFGCGASGYIDNYRYDNTRSITKYLNNDYIVNKEELSLNETIENEFILGLRKIEGIDINTFKSKYNKDLLKFPIINKLIKEEKIEIINNHIRLTNKYMYLANEVLMDFLGEDYE